MIENKINVWGLLRTDDNNKPPLSKCRDYFVESDEGEIRKEPADLEIHIKAFSMLSKCGISLK